MRDRSALYIGILLVVLGGMFTLVGPVSAWLGIWGIELGWAALWPLIILGAAAAFWLPLLVWWERREGLAGLAVPASILTVLGLVFFYNTLTGDWGAWSYLWTFIPISVALGLLALYALGHRDRGLLLGATIVGSIGLVFFMVFSMAFGGVLRLLAPVALILVGLFIIMGAARGRAERPWPDE